MSVALTPSHLDRLPAGVDAPPFDRRKVSAGIAHIGVGMTTMPGGVTAYWVRDDGVGFDMAGAADLFQPFRRLHAEREFQGMGIGLAIVQRVIARHGGSIWAESAPGRGAVFRFTLGAPRPEETAAD